MLNSLTIASEGYLKCGNPLQIAVDGYLDNCDGTIPVDPPIIELPVYPGGGSTPSHTYRGMKKLGDKNWVDFYKKMEDEDILIIIKSFIKCQ